MMTRLFRQISDLVHKRQGAPKVGVRERSREFASLNLPSGKGSETGCGFGFGQCRHGVAP
jgi:hypothetical protein